MFTWYSFFRNQRGGFRMELIKINDRSMFGVLSKECTINCSADFAKARTKFDFTAYTVVINQPELRGNVKYQCIKELIEAEYGEINFTKDNLIIFYK